MKRIFILSCFIILSLSVFTGCGKKKAVEKDTETEIEDTEAEDNSSKVVDVDLTYDDLYKANNGYTLLDKYISIEYELTTYDSNASGEDDEEGKTEKWDLYKLVDDIVVSRESDSGEYEAFLNGTCYYKNTAKDKDNPKYSKGWFMDNVYDSYVEESINNFLISETSGEDFDKIEEKDGKYTVLSYVGEKDKEKYYYRYTIDKNTYEIEQYEAVIIKTGKKKDHEKIVAKGIVRYGKEIKLPDFIKDIENENVNKRSITIHKINESGEEEDSFVVEIPENCTLIAALEDGYGLYKDKNAEAAFDDTKTELNENKVYPNTECYLMPKRI